MRVVVTGLGLVTPLGVGVSKSWTNLCLGKSGVRSTTQLHYLYASLASRVAAWIDESDLEIALTKEKTIKSLPKYIKYALIAAEEAITDSNLDFGRLGGRAGVCVGSGMSPLDIIGDTHMIMLDKGARKISPHFIPRILPNMAAGHISIEFGIKGPLFSPSAACTTGTHAIGDAFRLIRHGYTTAMIAGATEAAVNSLSMAGFCQARALSTTYNDHPEESSRPFDSGRDGFVIGEGAGIMVLEERQHAIERGANIYAEVLGYGCSADSHHITASHPEGMGAKSAMREALEDAQISSQDVDYINAHATSTPIGDLAEAKAIGGIFKDRDDIILGSNKGAIGHLLGAAGAVESIFAVLSIYKSIVPPTLNCKRSDIPEIGKFNIFSEASRSSSIRMALKNSFGFGGTNGSLCFASYDRS